MQVREVMTSTVVSINVDTPINEAVAAMRMNNVSFLPVTHEKVCAGVLTEHDITARMHDEGFDPTATTAGMLLAAGKDRDEVSSIGVHAVSQDASVDEALQMMTDLHLHHLAVRDDEYIMVGVVTRADLEQPMMAEAT
ncbi:MAG TPA: CBS domain-containing protein [Planctomycetaceae bacterium]|nr:CBS domain-containing protein [Planctomycetaceae bacterium]